MKSYSQMWQRCLSVLLILCMVTAYLLPNITPVTAADIGAVLWVDPVNGDNANDGTSETSALKTISAAKTKAATLSESSDVVVYLKGGTYAEGQTITFGKQCMCDTHAKNLRFPLCGFGGFLLVEAQPQAPGEHTCSGTQGNPAAMRWKKITR